VVVVVHENVDEDKGEMAENEGEIEKKEEDT
jgi:hypothetical protein